MFKKSIFIVILVLSIILICTTGCLNTTSNLKLGDTAVLKNGDQKLAVTALSAKIIDNPPSTDSIQFYDADYDLYSDGITGPDNNIIAIRVKVKNVGDVGIQQKFSDPAYWSAKGIDYAGFTYRCDYVDPNPFGLYPGEERNGIIKIYHVPDKALDGLVLKYYFEEEASWILEPCPRGYWITP